MRPSYAPTPYDSFFFSYVLFPSLYCSSTLTSPKYSGRYTSGLPASFLVYFVVSLSDVSNRPSGYSLPACASKVPISQDVLVAKSQRFPQDLHSPSTPGQNRTPSTPLSKPRITICWHGQNKRTRFLLDRPRSQWLHQNRLRDGLKAWFHGPSKATCKHRTDFSLFHQPLYPQYSRPLLRWDGDLGRASSKSAFFGPYLVCRFAAPANFIPNSNGPPHTSARGNVFWAHRLRQRPETRRWKPRI